MQLCGSLNIIWQCISLGLEWKLAFSSPVASNEFSKFAGILKAIICQLTEILSEENYKRFCPQAAHKSEAEAEMVYKDQ